MSYLTFGEFAFSGSIDRGCVEALSWRLFKHGADHGVYLLFGCNIPQSIVFEMLGAQKGDPPTGLLPFLATASPLDDTSDALLSPYALVGSSGTDASQIERSLQQLQAVFSAAFAESDIQTVTLFITEGFDNTFAPVFTSVDEFAQAAARIFTDRGTWPSVRFVIRRQEAG